MPALDDKGNIIQREILSLDASRCGIWVVGSTFLFSILLDWSALTQRIPSPKANFFPKHLTIKGPSAVPVWHHLSGAAYIVSFSVSGSYFTQRVPFNEETLIQVSRSKVKVTVYMTCKIIVGPYFSYWPSVDYSSLGERVCNAIEPVLKKDQNTFEIKFLTKMNFPWPNTCITWTSPRTACR